MRTLYDDVPESRLKVTKREIKQFLKSWYFDIFAEFKQNSVFCVFWNNWQKQRVFACWFFNNWITELLSKSVTFSSSDFRRKFFGIRFSRFFRAKVAWGLNKSLRSEFWFEPVWNASTRSQLCHSVTPLSGSQLLLAGKTIAQWALLSLSHSFRRCRVVHT